MTSQMTEQLRSKHCAACEGESFRLSAEDIQERLASLDGWKLENNAHQLRKEWTLQDFAAGLDFFNRVGDLAEREGHHPDLHLTGYRHAAIVLSTHAVDGLSENDFILAAKIDELPVHEKS